MRKSIPLVVIVVVVLALSLLYVRPEPDWLEPTAPTPADTPPTQDATDPTPAPAWTPPDVGPEQPVFEALRALSPHARVIRCSAPDLSRRAPIRTTALDGEQDTVPYATLVGGDLVAAVTSASGRAGLLVDLEHVGVLTWQDTATTGVGTCTIDPVEWVTLTGTIEGYTPTTLVRGCGPAEVVKPDDNGHFEMQAALGTPCHPFAFDDRGSTFAKGPVVELIVDGHELHLRAPGKSDRLSLAQQKERLGTFVALFDGTSPEDPFAEPLSNPTLADDVRAVLTAWAESEDSWAERQRTQLEEMARPDADPAQYRDLWLRFY